MALTKGIKISIGKETTPGDYVMPDAVVPVKSPGSVDRKIERTTDPAIVGTGMLTGEYPVSASVDGDIELAPRACKGFEYLLEGALGNNASILNVVGLISIKYTGIEDSCKLEVAGGDLIIKAGPAGNETMTVSTVETGQTIEAILEDLGIGCTGRVISGAVNNQVTGYYIPSGTAQAKNRWALVYLTGAAGNSGAILTPDLNINNDRPTFTMQFDGWFKNYRRSGFAVKSLKLSSAVKGFVDGSCSILGMKEEEVVTPVQIAFPQAMPFVFASGITSIGGQDYKYTRDVSLSIENNLRDDGYAQDSFDRAYHQKGLFEISGDITLRLDAETIGFREMVSNPSSNISALFVFRGKKTDYGLHELLVIDVPYISISSFEFADSNDVFDAKLGYKAYNPGNAGCYDAPITIGMLYA